MSQSQGGLIAGLRRRTIAPMPKPGTLSDGARVHVVRDAAITYRENGGPEDEHEAARVLARLAYDAKPIERALELEVWTVLDAERELDITLRVIRWSSHAVVLGVTVQSVDAERLGEATPTADALTKYMAARGCDERLARAELRAAAWEAKPVDLDATPALWRYRSALAGESISLRVVRAGVGRTLIVKAEPSM